MCAIQETLQPHGDDAAVVVMGADHGIAEEGVSAYPQHVTGQMVANFLRGGAAINVLARRQRADIVIVDMGIKDPSVLSFAPSRPGWVADVAVARGTANFLRGPAMTRAQVEQAIAAARGIVA